MSALFTIFLELSKMRYMRMLTGMIRVNFFLHDRNHCVEGLVFITKLSLAISASNFLQFKGNLDSQFLIWVVQASWKLKLDLCSHSFF